MVECGVGVRALSRCKGGVVSEAGREKREMKGEERKEMRTGRARAAGRVRVIQNLVHDHTTDSLVDCEMVFKTREGMCMLPTTYLCR